MKKTIVLLAILLLQTSCKEKAMEGKTNFIYSISISAEEEYPAEVHEGVLSLGNNFITAIPRAGTAQGGWGFGGGDAGIKASTIPNHLELTWLSYAEKKFWKIDTALPADKMLALFREGVSFYDRDNIKQYDTYGELCIGLAPGGVVVLWLDGSVKKVEVGRFQAKEVYVDKFDFQPVKIPDETQEQFFDTWFKIGVPKETQTDILQKGIPFGLWDAYRTKYNWRYHTLSYKEGVDEFVSLETRDYINGEFSMNHGIDNDGVNIAIVNNFSEQPIPWRSDFTYKDYSSTVTFNKREIMTAFKTLSKKHPNEPIEIEVKVKFMYEGLTFKVKCGGDEVELNKTKVTMYVN